MAVNIGRSVKVCNTQVTIRFVVKPADLSYLSFISTARPKEGLTKHGSTTYLLKNLFLNLARKFVWENEILEVSVTVINIGI
jgi:hypothetical protein